LKKEILAYEGDQPFIFLSYSHRDILQVEPIIQGLQQLGYRVWFDRGLHGGDQYSDVIAGKIDACHCFMPLLSRHFLESDYCMDETHYALEIEKSILPVYLEDVQLSGGLRMRLSRFHALWCTRSSFWREIERSDPLKLSREKPKPIPVTEDKPTPKPQPKAEGAFKPESATLPTSVSMNSSSPEVVCPLGKNVLKKNYKKKFKYVRKNIWGQKAHQGNILSITILNTTARAPKNSWDVSEARDGSVLAWVERTRGKYGFYDFFIAGDRGVYAPANCLCLFADYTAVTTINFGNNFHTSGVTTMEGMFHNCSNLTSLNLGDKFNTSNVMNMKCMFGGCTSLPALDLGDSFDTSNVTNMEWMFRDCSSLTSLSLGNGFDTSNVTNMWSMFENCSCLMYLNLRNKFDTSNVTDMEWLFKGCSNLQVLYLGDKFDTSNTKSTVQMFKDCSSLTSLSLGNRFDTSNVTNMGSMFASCSSLKTLNLGNKFDTSSVWCMSNMFHHCPKLTTLDVANWDLSAVTSYEDFMNEGQLLNGRPWEELFQTR